MKRIGMAAASLLLLVGCTLAQRSKKVEHDGPEAPYLRVIDTKCKELMKLGRATKSADCAILIGQYHWHGNGSGYFGTYEFYQPAFDQAKRGWWGIHGTVIEGNDELWVEDNSVNSWCSSSSSIGTLQPGESASVSPDSQCGHDPYPIVFDSSVVGRTVGPMYMSYVGKDGKYAENQWFSAKVIAIIDEGRNLKLDKRAPHHAEQYQMAIAPADYVDMCNCTNNFGPQFVDGHPVTE